MSFQKLSTCGLKGAVLPVMKRNNFGQKHGCSYRKQKGLWKEMNDL